ncbi:hypothetical protein ETR_20662 [Erwinia tracheiphila PSU-1]|nr:hypothetical protein ETR_20662 [Erwinia tracheiphila PSU-1]
MKNINQLLAIFSTLMTTDGYPVARPVDPDVLANLINKSSPEDWDELKKPFMRIFSV